MKRFDSAPSNSIILDGYGAFNYCDSFCVEINSTDTVDNITTGIFCSPSWADYLLAIRDAIVKVFGLRTGSAGKPNIQEYYNIGDKAGLFTVCSRNENEIVMSEDDKHLSFRTSVFIDRSGAVSKVYLTTIVKYHNLGGKLYFIPVKPFHRLIIQSSLRKWVGKN